jgi:hypothetical protein
LFFTTLSLPSLPPTFLTALTLAQATAGPRPRSTSPRSPRGRGPRPSTRARS